MYTILAILLVLICLGSIFTIPFGLPGTFFMVGFAFLFKLIAPGEAFSWNIVGILLLIAIALEGLEYLFSLVAARKYGASGAGVLGAIAGSILGAFIGSGFIPLAGSLIGAFCGAFLGAFIIEYLRNPDTDAALKAGTGAFLGAVGGKLTKIIGSIAMLILIILKL